LQLVVYVDVTDQVREKTKCAFHYAYNDRRFEIFEIGANLFTQFGDTRLDLRR
jgi:hypothetical protein